MGEIAEAAQQAGMSPEASAAVEEAIERAQQSMGEASEALEDPSGSMAAAEAQREAVDALRDAAREAQQGAQPQTEEQRQRAEELAERQRALEEKLLALAERNEERNEMADSNQALSEAAESASEASDALESGDLDEAEAKEEETEQKIEEALDELEEEEEQYDSLRQEELLFQIKEEVIEIEALHRVQMQETRELDATRKARPSRSEKIRLRNISREEEALATRIDGIVEAIRAEGTLVFAEVLDRAARDLRRVVKDLSDAGGYRSGERTQALQEDVADGLALLREALEDELERRAEEEQQQQEQQDQEEQQQQDSNQLIPDVAELKLLAKLEEDLLQRVDQLYDLYPEIAAGEELDPLILRDIARLASQHERILELFTDMRQRLGFGQDQGAPSIEGPDQESEDR